MELHTRRQADTQAADETRLGRYLRTVWPANLSREARLNLLALYHGIAGENGGPLAVPHAEIPRVWLEHDPSGELVGVAGLSRARTPHELKFGRRTLYAWCAFDCMFLPELLGATLVVRSTCPASGEEIALRVSAWAVEHVTPKATMISFVTPDAAAVAQDFRRAFCRKVRFFTSERAAGASHSEGAALLTPRLAHRLGAIRNHTVFGDTLAADLR